MKGRGEPITIGPRRVIAASRPVAPDTSWWMREPREGFTAAASQHLGVELPKLAGIAVSPADRTNYQA